VLSFASNAFTASPGGVMTELDQKYWVQRPLYVLSPENAVSGQDVTAELTRLHMVDQKSHADHFIGIGPAGVPTGMTDALNLYRQNLKTVLRGARNDFGNYYDAFYFLTYSMYASNRDALFDGSLEWRDLAKGMRRLTAAGKLPLDVGPTGISDVFSALSVEGASIQLDGTMGPPDFDSKTGMRRESGSVYCFDSTYLSLQPDVLRYDRSTGKLISQPHPLCLYNF
jgi:hypothetical protein